MPARVGGEGEGDASSLTNSERDGRGRGRGRGRGGPPPPPPLVPTATVPSLRIFAPTGVISPTTASGRVVPPPPPARAPASASAVSLGRGANRTAPPPPPKPKLPTSSELAGVIASLEAAVEAEREEMEAGEVKIPPPKPPPPKPPQPPPPKPPKPPPPKPPKPPAGAPPPEAMVSRAKKMRISLREADPIVVPTPTEKPSSSDEEEEEESESEPEEGEIAPRLVELLPQDDFTAKENDEDGLASPTFKKAKPDATSHDLMGGGEFDTLESLTRVQDVSAEVLNNINSPQFRKRTPISPPQKLANDSKCLDAKLKRLLEVRKLPLVLDLDHTLLNTVLVRDLRQNASTLINAMRLLDADVARAAKTNNPLARSVFHLEHMDLLTKLRPGVRLFLEKASELFELHINTMGSQLYADQMAALLDPKRRWINGEIRGLGEMEDGILIAPSEKSLNGTLEGIADACLIFDDTVSVWASHRRNLITCERYLFFPNARKQFGLPGLSLLDVGQDECAEEGMLATAMKVLTSVHKDYFDRYDALNRPPSVADILQEHRKDVLAGVNIVFSRVFPIHTDPTNHPLWTLAEDFGAKCSPTLTEETTHVVAAARTTDKVKEAIKRGNIRIVSPQWLECSILLWKRANEHTFSVGK